MISCSPKIFQKKIKIHNFNDMMYKVLLGEPHDDSIEWGPSDLGAVFRYGEWKQKLDKIISIFKETMGLEDEAPIFISILGSRKFSGEIQEISDYINLGGDIPFGVLHGKIDDEDMEKFYKTRKTVIGMSDLIIVCSIDNYVGKFTEKEVLYAKSKNKPILFIH